jgi:hypothetical protein
MLIGESTPVVSPSPLPTPAESVPSGWGDPVAVATLVLAVVTVLSVGVSLYIAYRDRESARSTAEDDRATAQSIAKADRDGARGQDARARIVDMLPVRLRL